MNLSALELTTDLGDEVTVRVQRRLRRDQHRPQICRGHFVHCPHEVSQMRNLLW
jgi:hypothetical protein